MNPRYPIYIPSKGRWLNGQTPGRLHLMQVPFFLVVEECEEAVYREHLPFANLIVLPFSNLGQGSIPARNFIWEHSLQRGDERHWIMDDNISRFYRLNLNRRIPVTTGTIFRCAEDFTERFTNVAFSGLNYESFANEREPHIAPYRLNTRIYSMILVNNALPYRWRGRYNEDTDICLRALKDGWVTILFNAFLGKKIHTMTMKGGNTEQLYSAGDHRLAFAESLAEQHPDHAKVGWKYGRWHHQVNYAPFKRNKPKLREGIVPTGEPNEYGMFLRRANTTQERNDNE